MDKQAITGKRRARKLALQALYQWHMAGGEMHDIEAQFHVENNMDRVDTAYFSELLRGVSAQANALDEAFKPYLDRELSALNPVELTILRMGSYELLHQLQIPYKVVLDEAISLTKSFGATDGFRYVNGVLNQVAQQSRQIEIRAEHE